ncbi:MAG: transcriptional regulator [Hyphomicrobiales bacterium]|nr:MAG: transcriptional regulator [Hyphomicrobiales bacterium]
MAGREPTISHLDRLIVRDGTDHIYKSENEVFKIGDLAKEFSVTLRTLRFYEDRGLMTPARNGSTRLYSLKDRSRLKLILLAKRVGFSLIEIHELMEIYDLGDQNNWHLQLVLDKFRGQMVILSEQKIELDKSIEELGDIVTSLEGML